MRAVPASPLLAGYYVISLRPAGAHAGLRRAAARAGARTFALSPWRLLAHDDAVTRDALETALAADVVVFTSPPAVRAAAALRSLVPGGGTRAWLAVGSATAAALRRAGCRQVLAPARMDSEGLLALPALADVAGSRVGLVTAPGGRGLLAATLAAAGATIARADVYTRVPTPPSAARVAALLTLPGPWLLPVSSGEALEHTLAHLPAPAVVRLRQARVVAASTRLAELAARHGFDDVRCAADARPVSLLAAGGDPSPDF